MSPPACPDWDHEARLRVRYPEVDPQGVVHHSVYLHYFELGRTEMLRDRGVAYSDLEREGARLVVTEAALRYHAGTVYDDVLVVRTRVDRLTRTRIVLVYEVRRESTGELACSGTTVLASLAASGRPTALPERLRSAFDTPAR